MLARGNYSVVLWTFAKLLTQSLDQYLSAVQSLQTLSSTPKYILERRYIDVQLAANWILILKVKVFTQHLSRGGPCPISWMDMKGRIMQIHTPIFVYYSQNYLLHERRLVYSQEDQKGCGQRCNSNQNLSSCGKLILFYPYISLSSAYLGAQFELS